MLSNNLYHGYTKNPYLLTSLEKDIIMGKMDFYVYINIYLNKLNENNEYFSTLANYNTELKYNINNNDERNYYSNYNSNYKRVQSFDFDNNDFYYQDNDFYYQDNNKITDNNGDTLNYNFIDLTNYNADLTDYNQLCSFCGKQSHNGKQCHKIINCKYCRKKGHSYHNCYDLAKDQNRFCYVCLNRGTSPLHSVVKCNFIKNPELHHNNKI